MNDVLIQVINSVITRLKASSQLNVALRVRFDAIGDHRLHISNELVELRCGNGYVDGLPHSDDLFGDIYGKVANALQIGDHFQGSSNDSKVFCHWLFECEERHALRFNLPVELVYHIVVGDHPLSDRSITHLEGRHHILD